MLPAAAEGLRSRARQARQSADLAALERSRNADSHRRLRRSGVSREGLSLRDICDLRPARLSTPWRTLPCPHCGARLLTGEATSWGCKDGSKHLDPLPPLPECI